jgi:dolichyl-phosphate-mannose--protein O-mannosyl transferase
MVSYWWLIPLSILMVVNAFLSAKASSERYAFILLWVLSVVPIWPLVAKYSRNIVLDAMIYDSAIAVTYGVAIIYFSQTTLSPKIIIGTIMCISGVILIATEG